VAETPHPDNPRGLPVAVVTGASSGIGAALAAALAERGHCVALAARRADRLAAVAAQIHGRGGAAFAVPTDATDPGAVAALCAAARARGAVTVVVANAGVYGRGLASELTAAAMDAALRDNFWSAFHLAQAALPLLRERRGQLVFVASFDAKKGLPMDAAYATAKCALAGYAASLRQALHGSGVQVGIAFPGRVDTPMIDQVAVPWASPKIPTERAVRAILWLLRHRRAEVVVPWWCRPLWWADVLSPRLGDWLVRVLRLDGSVRG
jgi:short-subunit dehydrogenase